MLLRTAAIVAAGEWAVDEALPRTAALAEQVWRRLSKKFLGTGARADLAFDVMEDLL